MASSVSRHLLFSSGVWKRLHVDVILAVATHVSDPSTIRREDGEGIRRRIQDDGKRFAIPGQWQHPDVGFSEASSDAILITDGLVAGQHVPDVAVKRK